MLSACHVERVPEGVRALQTVIIFPVSEDSKERRRVIKHTKNINATPLEIFSVKFPTPSELDNSALMGDYVACIDFSAYFDQIGLDEETRNLHCFLAPDGHAYRLTRLPMGQRQAVGVACAVTDAVLSFNHRSSISTCIDNIRFVGSHDAVLADLTTALERCRKVGLTVNEFPADRSIGEAGSLISHEATFMGRLYDHQKQTVRLSAKTVGKLELLLAHMRDCRPTWRNVAALLGLLFFAQHVLLLPISCFGNAFRMYREVSRLMALGELQWDQLAVMQPCQWKELQQWTELAIANRPRSLAEKVYTDVICTDASKSGWGFCHMDLRCGGVSIRQGNWSAEYDEKRISTHAESDAINAAICMAIDPRERRTLLVLTDADVPATCLNKKYAKSWYINQVLHRIATSFPHLTVVAQHIPGETNIVDGVSRGESIATLDTGEVGKWLRRHVGSVCERERSIE